MTSRGPSLGLCYEATFDVRPMPFKISVKEDFLQRTLQKISLTRFVDDELNQLQSTDGPPTISAQALAEYWMRSYDWTSVEASLNSTLRQFTVLVSPSQSPANFIDDVPLHFVHHRSTRQDAIPLLFVHGWPGSFIEVAPIIHQLTDPPDAKLPAFHVVAPSIPGYGFSPSPRKPGMGYRAVAATFHALMTVVLGYSKYVLQGGDAGDIINRYMAHDFPRNVVSAHSNFWVVPPTSAELEAYRTQQFSLGGDEHYFSQHWTEFFETGWGYAQIQQTRPLKLAHGLTDSPVGLAMWIYDAVLQGIEPSRRDEVWSMDTVITWTMMHWLNGPYGAFSLYKQGAKDGAIDSHGIRLLPYVTQPVSISQFPYDIWYRLPLAWAQRAGNVVERNVHAQGGHFPSVHNSAALLRDVWKFFGNQELSNTIVFGAGAAVDVPEQDV